jgi:hypothetical protein
MKFTIVFPSHESEDLSIAAVFTPCLVWMQGKNVLLNPHPDYPHYRKGDLRTLFTESTIRQKLSTHTNKVTVIAHSIGHGSEADLEHLKQDLTEHSFEVTVVHQ